MIAMIPLPEITRLVLALGGPWLAASLLLWRGWPEERPGRWAGAVGIGYFLGMFGVAVVLLGLEAAFGRWLFYPALVAFLVLALGVTWLMGSGPHRSGRVTPAVHPLRADWRNAPSWVQVLVVLMIAAVTVRLGGMLLEVLLRPVYAWDAWYHWTYRARAFFEQGHADAFVSYSDFWHGEPEGYLQSFRHPSLVSVIQLWPALALGRWHETLVNMPWFLAGPALGLAVFGQLRRLGAGVLPAVLVVYLTLSVPLLGLHVGLGGYADIWMVAAFGIAALSMLALLEEPRWREWLVFLPMLALMPFIKQAGILFAVPFLVALLLGWMRPMHGLLVGLLTAAAVLVAVAFLGLDFRIPGLGRVFLDSDGLHLPRGGLVTFDPQWSILGYRLFAEASWHLLFWLGGLLLFMGIPAAWDQRLFRALWILVTAVVVMTFVVYGATLQADKLVDGTGFGRHLLPLVPVLAAWFGLLLPYWAGVLEVSPRYRDMRRRSGRST